MRCSVEGIATNELSISGSSSKEVYSAERRIHENHSYGKNFHGKPGTTFKKRERKGPSQGIIPKCEPHERGLCAPKFMERPQEETLQQGRCARGVA